VGRELVRTARARARRDGAHLGKPFHAALHREPAPLLMTRGFHWINEAPWNL